MTRADPDLDTWYESCFAELVTRPEVRRSAQLEAARLGASSGITPQAADLEAARPYLKRCLRNMSVVELENLSAGSAGALWARGALGAARYRQRPAKPRRNRLGRLRPDRPTHTDED